MTRSGVTRALAGLGVMGLAATVTLGVVARVTPAEVIGVTRALAKGPPPRSGGTPSGSQPWAPRDTGALQGLSVARPPPPPPAVELELHTLFDLRYVSCNLPFGARVGRSEQVRVFGGTAWRVPTAAGTEEVQDARFEPIGRASWSGAEPGTPGSCVWRPGAAMVSGFADPDRSPYVWVCDRGTEVQADGSFAVRVPAPDTCSIRAGDVRLTIEIPQTGVAGLDLRTWPEHLPMSDPEEPRSAPLPPLLERGRRTWDHYNVYAGQVSQTSWRWEFDGDALTDDQEGLHWAYRHAELSPASHAWLGAILDLDAPTPEDPREALPTAEERTAQALWNTAEFLGVPLRRW